MSDTQKKSASIYEQMRDAGVQMDSHQSDLYVPVNETTTAILHNSDDLFANPRDLIFTNQTDGKQWYDLPFQFTPFWDKVNEAELSLYEKLLKAGVQMDSHQSDLYVPVNEKTTAILSKENALYADPQDMIFTDENGKQWYDLPHQYEPYFENKTQSPSSPKP